MFSIFFTKGHNLQDFLFPFLSMKPLQIGGYSQRKQFAPWSKLFPLRETNNLTGGNFFLVRITSPGSVPIHLKFIAAGYQTERYSIYLDRKRLC